MRALILSTWLTITGSSFGQSVAQQPPVTAIAYRPDGKQLFAGHTKEVLVIDLASGDVVAKLTGQGSKVTAVACRPDGQVLAIASGEPGQVGLLRIYALPASGAPPSAYQDLQPMHAVEAHGDLIHDMAFCQDGSLLATCGYDRLVKLWQLRSQGDRQELVRLQILKDHSDAVYGVAFSPDAKLLASAGADRAVKVWDLATGKRLYTLGEATDWLYAVAWSPDGQLLAAAGVDRSIRAWRADAQEGKIVQSVFGHTAPILRLLYGKDGQTLYSLGEDRTLKAWDTAKMVEKKVFAVQPETVLALGLHPNQQQLAIGRFDGVVQLLDVASGKVQSEPLPIKPKPPQLTKLTPSAGQRGRAIQVHVDGKYFDGGAQLIVSHPNADVKMHSASNGIDAELVFRQDTPAGIYQVQVKTPAGTSNALPFVVDLFATSAAKPSDTPSVETTSSALPVTFVGKVERAGQVAFHRFHAKPGEEVGVQSVLEPGSKLEPVLFIVDDNGRIKAESTDGLLAFRCPDGGAYSLAIRDREYRAEGIGGYRINAGPVPIVTGVFPLGLQRGADLDVVLEGVHLGVQSVRLNAPADAAIGSKVPVTLMTPLGPALGGKSLIVGAFPEAASQGGASAEVLTAPVTVNGQLSGSKPADTVRFVAKKGEKLIVEVNARRIGSPIDPYVEILDDQGKLLPRATLRSLAKSYLTFRDHDAASAALRVEAWSELAINDYVMIGNELLRIRAMPTHPDADMIFFSVAGQRTGYLSTTPTHQPMGAAMYKVELHPPGTVFPPSAYPNFTIYYRNDDGGPGYGKDPMLSFDPPADGTYQVRVGDAGGSPERATSGYRLTVRRPQPSFNVRFNPTSPNVAKGGAIAIDVTAERQDGFDDAIALQLDNLPAGLTAPATTIPAGETTTSFALYAEASASLPKDAKTLKLVARAKIDGQDVVRETMGGQLKLVDPGDLVTVTEQPEVAVRPGGEVRLTTKIERRNGFAGRVPIEVKGLPHGVKVRDIGLNGILITEKETVRTFVIYAEPWVQPQEHPIVVLAKREGKNTEHAAKSVLLKIVK